MIEYSWVSVSVIVFLLGVSFFLGVAVGLLLPSRSVDLSALFITWPYVLLRKIAKIPSIQAIRLRKLAAMDRYSVIPSEAWDVDLDKLIEIRTSYDVSIKREALIDLIWKGSGLPTRSSFDRIESTIEDARYKDLANLQTIDKFTVSMDFGVDSIIYHFRPRTSNSKLIIYHQGHYGDFFLGKEVIRFFLENRCEVLAFAMPLRGMNNKPVADIDHLGKVRLASHGELGLLDSPSFSALRFFVEPLAVAMNYMASCSGFDSASMVGISGGGWTTVLYSALDPSITSSYPTAGTIPLFLSYEGGSDYEVCHPELNRMANNLERYILGSAGVGRRQLQIFNKYDPAYAWGIRYQVYEEKIKSVLRELGTGAFSVYLDTRNTKHSISRDACHVILRDILQSSSDE